MIKNSNGFSITELMIAGGLLGVLALGGMKLFRNQNVAQKTVERNYEVAAALEQMRAVLASPTNCLATFQGQNPASGQTTDIKKIVNGLTSNIFPINTGLPSGLKILSYKLDKTNPTLATNETHLKIRFSRGAATLKDQTDKFINITYVVDASNQIIACSAVSGNNDFWKQASANPNDIFYAGGNVGVGKEPTTTLDVNGPIKIGNSTATCTEAQEGQIRYEPIAKNLQFCNGVEWKGAMGSGMDYAPTKNGLVWSSVTFTGIGYGTSVGTPMISLQRYTGPYTCSSLRTIILNNPEVSTSTKAALISFASFDTTEQSPSARIFDMSTRFVGLVGRSGRGGDGRGFGAGGEVVVPLTNRQFQMQGCKADGRPSTFWYAVKAVLND